MGDQQQSESHEGVTHVPEILKSGAASLGCLLSGGGLVAIPLSFILGWATQPAGSNSGIAQLAGAVAVTILGFYLLRKFTVNTTGWFVLASLFFICCAWGASNGSQWFLAVFFFVFGWWAMFMNNQSAEKKLQARGAGVDPTPLPAPYHEVVLNQNGQLVGDTPAPPISPTAGATSKRTRATGATIGCVTAVLGSVLVGYSILLATISGFGLLGDVLSGTRGLMAQDWQGASNFGTAGVLLISGGLVAFFYYNNKKD